MMSEQVDLAVLRRVASVSAQINDGRPLHDTLQAVAGGVVDALGFGAAAVNYVLASGDLQVMAVAGPPEACDALAGQIVEKAVMDDLLAKSDPWGPLRFVPHERVGDSVPVTWVPNVAVPEGADAWHPEDALLALLLSSDGTMVGVLSVDVPPGQRRPGPMLRELLDIFAVQAGVAIGNARLVDKLREEHGRLQASEAAFRFSFSASAGAMAMLSLDDRSGPIPPGQRVVLPGVRLRLADAAKTGPAGVVLYCDLDRLKQINDRYGHAVGDLVLQETVCRLKAQVRSADVIARLGGDEFVVVAVDLDREAAAQLVDRIHGAFIRPLLAVPEVVTISVGVAAFDGSTADVDALLHRADVAMYADKGAAPEQ